MGQPARLRDFARGKCLWTRKKSQEDSAAILAADIAGYSRLMEADEAGTLERLKALRGEIINPRITEHHGRIVKTTGDGVLVEFASVVNAVQCAVEVQREMARRNAGVSEEKRIEFRVGINLGDIIFDGDDIYGEGVNVAARLDGLAEPGSICVSGSVFEQVRNKVDAGFEDLGERAVKNLKDPVHVYRILAEVAVPAAPTPAGGGGGQGPSLPDKPSIAVLPFENMSGDSEQEYFSDGITEDIITDLSKVSGLFVIARNSTFVYKGKPVQVQQVGRDLGVRYVLEGSVRKAGDKVRITAQLVEATTGNHLWAERYDRELKDIFAVQDEVAEKVVSALAVTLKEGEEERLGRKHTPNLEAYDLFLQARAVLELPSEENVLYARKLFDQAIELDANFAGGYAGSSWVYSVWIWLGYSKSPREDAKRAFELAQRAMEVDPTFGWSHTALAAGYLVRRQPDQAVSVAERAVQIQPSDVDARVYLGYFLTWAGRPEKSIETLQKAIRLNPQGLGARHPTFLGLAYFTARRYEEAITTLEKLDGGFSPFLVSLAAITAAYTKVGREEEAKASAQRLVEVFPNFSVSSWGDALPYKNAQDSKHLLDALREAGLPE